MPNEGEAKIKLTGDDVSLVQAFKKGFKEVGEDAAKAGEKMFKGFSQSLIKLSAMKAVAQEIGKAIEDSLKNSAEGNRKAGASRVNTEVALSQLKKQTRSVSENLSIIRESKGARTQEEREAYAAQASDEFTESGLLGSFMAYNTGLATQEESLKAGKAGRHALRKLMAKVDKRRTLVSDKTRTELGVRSIEASDQLRGMMANEERTDAVRLAESQKKAFEEEGGVGATLVGGLKGVAGAATLGFGKGITDSVIDAGITGTLALRQGAAQEAARGGPKPIDTTRDAFTRQISSAFGVDQTPSAGTNVPGLGFVSNEEQRSLGAGAWTKQLLDEIRAQRRQAAGRPNLSAAQDR